MKISILAILTFAIVGCVAATKSYKSTAYRKAPAPPSATNVVFRSTPVVNFVPAGGNNATGNFLIITQTPVRRIVFPFATSYVAGICVLTPFEGNYQVQIRTNMSSGNWTDRLLFHASPASTSCWYVPLQTYETNLFFLRVRFVTSP